MACFSSMYWALVGLLMMSSSANALQAPMPLVTQQSLMAHAVTASLQRGENSLWNSVLPAKTTHDHAATLKILLVEANNFWIADGWDVARNIGLGITAVVFLLAGVTYLYASFIIPVAAQELEKECKELNPELWAEYQAKLGDGETIATRPDLMQEMGMKLQPLLEAKLAAAEAGEGEAASNKMPSALETTMNPMGSNSGVIDAEVVQDDVPTIKLTSTDQWDSPEDTKKSS
ncbi:expressed unknown protein [Seminavis robusta]|uniref:Uncharacterized protein n=1 Tax=Seminavis robusta TaxID=568900 RepID=A0A9N8E8D0_9STRA|nr:expressed unknown protein [Seminavis robusta]|eukprot:Sro732_g194400.1 n/a (232) ;mRNA; r:15546-16241